MLQATKITLWIVGDFLHSILKPGNFRALVLDSCDVDQRGILTLMLLSQIYIFYIKKVFSTSNL
jgi:hypothetical protein